MHELIGLRIVKWLHHQRTQRAENRRGRSDPNRQSQNRDHREAASFPERTQRNPKIREHDISGKPAARSKGYKIPRALRLR